MWKVSQVLERSKTGGQCKILRHEAQTGEAVTMMHLQNLPSTRKGFEGAGVNGLVLRIGNEMLFCLSSLECHLAHVS